MFYPFAKRSLTESLDKKIYQQIMQAAPGKYWAFRISYLLERAGFALGVMCLFIYYIGFSVGRWSAQLDNPQYEVFVEILAKGVAAAAILSVVGGFLASTLFRELEPLVQRAIRKIVKESEGENAERSVA